MSCVFCTHIQPEQKLYESRYFFVVFDIAPIQEGLLLVISKAHRMNYRELNEEEIIDLNKLINQLIVLYEDRYHVGVSVIMNNGKQMDDNLHFHVHILPRYQDDAFWDHVEPKHHSFDLEDLKHSLNNKKM